MDGATRRAAIEADKLASLAVARPADGTLLRTKTSWRELKRKATVSLPYHSYAANPDAATRMVVDWC
jgi:hypothetical protein